MSQTTVKGRLIDLPAETISVVEMNTADRYLFVLDGCRMEELRLLNKQLKDWWESSEPIAVMSINENCCLKLVKVEDVSNDLP